MVLVTFVVLYGLCATVLLLAVAQDRRRVGPQARQLRERDARPRGRGTQHELVFTTQH